MHTRHPPRRYSELEFADAGDELRVSSEAFVVKGDLAEVALDGRILRELKGPHHLQAAQYTVLNPTVVGFEACLAWLAPQSGTLSLKRDWTWPVVGCGCY